MGWLPHVFLAEQPDKFYQEFRIKPAAMVSPQQRPVSTTVVMKQLPFFQVMETLLKTTRLLFDYSQGEQDGSYYFSINAKHVTCESNFFFQNVPQLVVILSRVILAMIVSGTLLRLFICNCFS